MGLYGAMIRCISSDFVFEDHVMPTINGYASTWEAANALGKHEDDVTCFGHPRPLF
jgi:hypothetical protein